MKQLLIFLVLLCIAFGIDKRVIREADLNQDRIVINVSGEVRNPGPVKADPYTTVREILEQADPTEDADLSGLNPDMVLNDHDVLNIPRQKEPDEPERISINQSDAEELTKLSGIGPSIAQRIVEYRQEHGLFQKTEDLMNVPGIGPAKYDALSDQISL
jgi:competence protein ComEA